MEVVEPGAGCPSLPRKKLVLSGGLSAQAADQKQELTSYSMVT